MHILWLITARRGSQGVPGKNVADLAGHPLLAYRVRAALELALPQDVWVSTDSPDYREVAERYGCAAPFLRPAELSTDTASSVDVVLHAMDHARSFRYDAIGLLEPTSPFVRPETLRTAVARLQARPEAHGIVAVRAARPSRIYLQPDGEFLDGLAANLANGSSRRQDGVPEITPSGGFYIARWEAFLRHRTFYRETTLAHRVDDYEALEIDESIDLIWARFLVASGLVEPAAYGLPAAQASGVPVPA